MELTIRFTVYGKTIRDLKARAEARLAAFGTFVAVQRMEVSPELETVDGDIVTWQADVTAVEIQT